MANVATVYLKGPWGPGDKTWAKGYITKQDATGVWLNEREDWRGTSTFWPMLTIQKIIYDTGW